MYGEEPVVLSPKPMAFPVPPECQCGGMTLHDWYVGQALIGWMSNPHREGCTVDQMVRKAFMIADAVMEVREGRN